MTPVSFLGSFFSVLFVPRRTVRRILDQKPGYALWFLLLAESFIAAFSPAYVFGFNIWLENPMQALLMALVVMTLFNLLENWIGILGCFRIGKALNGKADLKETGTAYAWTFPPIFFSYFILQLVNIPKWIQVLNGEDPTQTSEGLFGEAPVFLLIKLVFLLPVLAFLVWWIVLAILALAEAHRFSGGKAFLTLLIASIPQIALYMALQAGFPLLFLLK